MNVDLREKTWCAARCEIYIYARYKNTTATATTTMATKCLRRHIACKAICATRALHRYEPGKSFISIDILAVQARTKSQSWDRRVTLKRPFTVSFRQDMACPGDPRVAAEQHRYSKHVQKMSICHLGEFTVSFKHFCDLALPLII